MKIKRDDYNSAIFKKEMGNIDYDSVNATAFNIEVDFGLFDHLTVKIPTADKTATNCFLENGFQLADTLVRYSFNLNTNLKSDFRDKCIIRNAVNTDLPILQNLAKNAFKIDRFHSDKTLNNDDCDLYYEEWIKNSYNGFADIVLVAEYDGIPVGFTTGKINNDMVALVLSAVDPSARGLGIYTTMIKAGIEWARSSGKSTLVVGTQIDNIAVQKAWIKLGFTVLDSQYVLQKGK